MNRQQGRRRILVAALMVLLGPLAIVPGASAKDAQKIPDYHSKADFKVSCELLGGTFSEDGLGNTECHYPDGSWTECDANGGDCWHTPARLAPPTGIEDPIPSAPIVDGTDQHSDGASADDSASGQVKHRATRHGKRHGHAGKKHRH